MVTEGILIKKKDGYNLVKSKYGKPIATTNQVLRKQNKLQELSVKNCESIGILTQESYPKEWGVEIETIEYGLGNDVDGIPVFETRYLLDDNDCLILKIK